MTTDETWRKMRKALWCIAVCGLGFWLTLATGFVIMLVQSRSDAHRICQLSEQLATSMVDGTNDSSALHMSFVSYRSEIRRICD